MRTVDVFEVLRVESGHLVHDRYDGVAWSDLFCLRHTDEPLDDPTSAFLEVVPKDPKHVKHAEK